MLANMGADADTIIAALLHDTVEDTPMTIGDIEAMLGKDVARLIDGVTKLSSDDMKFGEMKAEPIESLRKMFTLMQQDVRIMVIKLVDRLHNMQTIEFLSEQKKKSLAEETRDVFVKVADKLCMLDMREQLEELCIAALEPEIYEELLVMRSRAEESNKKHKKLLEAQIKKYDAALGARTTVEYAQPSWGRLREQWQSDEERNSDLSPGFFFLCRDIDSCYRVLGALHQGWQREVLSFKDFLNAPQVNGYEGLHSTIIMGDGTRVRCKIQTVAMHEYSRKGVATKCFDEQSLGLEEYIPWASRISPLTRDTEGSSADFWHSLQSDILGQTMVVHGPGDVTVQIPRSSSVLDAAIYLFQDEALRIKKILMKGKNVPFWTPAEYAARIDVELHAKPAVDRTWLRYVTTGVAAERIRSALEKRSRKERIAEGRQLLQDIFASHQHGFLEEVDDSHADPLLQKLQYDSLDDLYLAISDGRLDPENIYTALLPKKKSKSGGEKIFTVICTVQQTGVHIPTLIDALSKELEDYLISVQYNQKSLVLKANLEIPADAQVNIRQVFEKIGLRSIEIIERSNIQRSLLWLIILLWGVNPVVASWLLYSGMQVRELLIVRFITFGALSALFYFVWSYMKKIQLSPLPRTLWLALLPTAVTIALAVFTYLALASTMAPSLHLSILRLNILFIPLIHFLRKRNNDLPVYLLVSVLFVSCIMLLSAHEDGLYLSAGALFSFFALVSYVTYSFVIERVMHDHKIGLRYPALLNASGMLLAAVGLLLLITTPYVELPLHLVLLAALYTLLCVFIPHACFYALLKNQKFRNITDPFLFEIPIAIAAEIILLSLVQHPITYMLMGLLITCLVAIRWQRQRLLPAYE